MTTPHQNIWITLSRHEILQASIAGCQRRIASLEKQRPQYYGADERNNLWQIDITGTIAEYALAKALNLYIEPATDKKLATLPGDVGPYQLRSTQHKNGQLIIHEKDNPNAAYILAIVAEPQIKLAGYIYGHQAPQLGTKRQHGDYWIPQHNLQPITQLLTITPTQDVQIKTRKHTPTT